MSAELYSKVSSYHAQIGHGVDKSALHKLESSLLEEAKNLFNKKDYEGALEYFTHALALAEKLCAASDPVVLGATIHNVGSCLHHMGEMEAAQAYYEQALRCFEKAKVSRMEWLTVGDTNKRRAAFVKERLVDLHWGRKPDAEKYLDENGYKRKVLSPEELEAMKRSSEHVLATAGLAHGYVVSGAPYGYGYGYGSSNSQRKPQEEQQDDTGVGHTPGVGSLAAKDGQLYVAAASQEPNDEADDQAVAGGRDGTSYFPRLSGWLSG